MSGTAPAGASITALLGPTNTGKTHQAIEHMLEHESGMIGLPLRLLAREVYDRVTARVGEQKVALVTGEEKRIPNRPRYWVCTVEAMPLDRSVDFVAVDEIQLAAHPERGHVFTDRLLRARGVRETWFMGSNTMRPLMTHLVPTALIRQHPRFSRLTRAACGGLGALPPRSAVVAFSADRVYEIAERLRMRRGGAAVVLGALSPRARNAQVALYQAGEVDYLVATDAIGMGLNLDVDHVAFAETRKFDGREARDLEVTELAQIAGRAGRHMNDGTFGTLAPLSPFSDKVAHAIENHRFFPERSLIWRNSDLDFDSVDTLLASLRQAPRRPCLRLVQNAEDHSALRDLHTRRPVRARARGRDRVALLWDVCRIPDFAQLLFLAHINLLEQIFVQLSDRGRLDPEWMREHIDRLDDPHADLDMLLARMSFVRTWTYITHRSDWVDDALGWQGKTLAIEDRLSDALHEKLIARFVDSGRSRTRAVRRHANTIGASGPFSELLKLRNALAGEVIEDPNVALEALIDAPHERLRCDALGRILHEGRHVATLSRGVDLLHPEVTLQLPDSVGAGLRSRLSRRLLAWVRDFVDETLGALRQPAVSELSGAARGLVYQLEQGLGSAFASEAHAQLQALSTEDRRQLSRLGVRISKRFVYLPALLGTQAAARKLALVRAQHGPGLPLSSLDGQTSARARREISPRIYLALGFTVLGPRVVRVDVAERARRVLKQSESASPFAVPNELKDLLVESPAELSAVLRALGYRQKSGGRYRRCRPRRRAATELR